MDTLNSIQEIVMVETSKVCRVNCGSRRSCQIAHTLISKQVIFYI